MIQDYFWIAKNFDEYIEEQKNETFKAIEDIKKHGQTDIQSVSIIWVGPIGRNFINTLKITSNLFRFIEISHNFIEQIDNFLPALGGFIMSFHQIEYTCNKLISIYKDEKIKIEKKLKLLSDAEEYRLNEAIHCFYEKCYFSAIIMAVSAMELRLYNILKKQNRVFLEDTAKKYGKDVSELTFGYLFNCYLNNKQKFNKIIPEKHECIFQVCNKFRIFSVHPKTEYLDYNNANMILSAVFDFLLDTRLKI